MGAELTFPAGSIFGATPRVRTFGIPFPTADIDSEQRPALPAIPRDVTGSVEGTNATAWHAKSTSKAVGSAKLHAMAVSVATGGTPLEEIDGCHKIGRNVHESSDVEGHDLSVQ